jgi:hypothetical protein
MKKLACSVVDAVKSNPLYVLLVYALMVQFANFSWLFILFSSRLCDSFFLIFYGKRGVFA